MPKTLHDRISNHGRKAALSLACLLAAGVLVLWGWNTLAVDLFGAPAAKFKHALAFEAAAGRRRTVAGGPRARGGGAALCGRQRLRVRA